MDANSDGNPTDHRQGGEGAEPEWEETLVWESDIQRPGRTPIFQENSREWKGTSRSNFRNSENIASYNLSHAKVNSRSKSWSDSPCWWEATEGSCTLAQTLGALLTELRWTQRPSAIESESEPPILHCSFRVETETEIRSFGQSCSGMQESAPALCFLCSMDFPQCLSAADALRSKDGSKASRIWTALVEGSPTF